MNAKLLTIPTALAGGAGGTYLGYKYLPQGEQKISIKSKLGDLLLGFDGSYDSKWKDRSTLVSSKANLPESLSALKETTGSKAISETNIKKWCQEQIEKDFSSETDSLFVSVRDYCTFNNKDKLGEKVITEALASGSIPSSGKWSSANNKLKQASDQGMSDTMKGIRTKLNASNGGTDNTQALKTWCESIYPSYFKGKEDPVFKDAKTYCVEATQ
ncbi:hypothetical protein HF1_14020 [Mycoplasma haemofelis str. Langford 1]|uniref:Uncharacterized protein n=1 Tax=Mycoplasma haemofelis (strain Langford 1) TaxID=941640 RepID=E8ZJT9_MYCHL|nr:hypothetical protein [Mycoplasma haemofelis]CBY93410.1 hypothetical protein HF1_14020 [Mycoplasma haemofelis str. Langford 1]